MANLGHKLNPETSFAQQASTSIGTALENLAQQKLRQKEMHNKQNLYSGLVRRPEVANYLAHLNDEKEINNFLGNLHPDEFHYGNQAQQNTNGYQQGMEGSPDQYQNQNFNPQQNQFPTQNQGQPGFPGMDNQSYAQQPGNNQQIANQPGRGLFKSKESASNPGQTQQIKMAQEKAQEIIELGNISTNNLELLKEYENILKNENISSAGYFNFAKLTGNTIANPTQASEVLSKISEQLVPPARSDAELRSFKARVPNPGQSKGAQLRLVKSLQKDMQRNIKQSRAANDILMKNNGIAPVGIDRLINNKLGIKDLEQDISNAPEGYSVSGQFNKPEEISDVQDGDIIVDTQTGTRKQFYNGKWRPMMPGA